METESESYQHQLDDVYLMPSTVSEVDSQSKLSRMVLFVIFFFSLYFVFAAAATTTRDVNTARNIDSNKLLLQKTKRPDTDLSAEIGIETSSPDYPKLSSLEYLPWENVIEPYRNQTLAVSSVVIDGKDVLSNGKMKDYIFHWNINDYFFEGEEITVNLPFVGVYDCNVSLIDQSEGATYTSNFTLAIKYVRREIKSLTDTDRDDFFSALQILYTVNMTTGTALYGEKYANAEYFLYKHLTGAGRSDCDHWHDGAAFPTIHTAFTLFAEQALQSINPSIAMPYWEYAQDKYIYEHWFESEIFNEDWFGPAFSQSKYHNIDDGIWKNLDVPDGTPYLDGWDIAETGSLNPYVNAYGQMRSPWNNNPTSFVGRFNKTYFKEDGLIPDCSHMSGCYDSRNYKKMANCLNGATHGPVHIQIGGAWGVEEDLFDDPDLGFLDGVSKILFFKMLWRSGFTRCPTSCSRTGKDDDCACAVPDVYIQQLGAKKMLTLSGILDASEELSSTNNATLFLKVLKGIEDPGIVGDMLTSGASYDPTFWPVHGQLERLLGLKRIRLARNETEFDETWGFATGEDALYLKGVCDWSNVGGPTDVTLPSCNMSLDAICPGHNEDDVMEFSNFLNQGEQYTNRHFYDFTHPWSDELPYTYDAFDFDYCADEGYEI